MESKQNNIRDLLNSFSIEYIDYGNRLTGRCPIHDGDNKQAFSIYTESGAWRCFTAGCHEHNGNLYGLIKLLLKKRGLDYSHKNITRFIEVKNEYSDGSINYRFLVKDKKDKIKVPRQSILKKLDIPAAYFINRKFLPETLIKYDVGLCTNKNSKYYSRAIVPIYNLDHTHMVGFTARTTCGEDPKWLHSEFNRDNSLYNSWFAKTELEQTNTCVLVESPGNVWRLEESGIHCGLAMYGTQLSFGQMRLLANLGILNIVLALDNDEAGKTATALLVQRLKGLYNIVIPKIEYEDLAECPVQYLKRKMSSCLSELLG